MSNRHKQNSRPNTPEELSDEQLEQAQGGADQKASASKLTSVLNTAEGVKGSDGALKKTEKRVAASAGSGRI